LITSILNGSAQQPQSQTPQQSQQPYTLKVSTQLVIETVVVKDKDGKPIEDLSAKDFIVTEDGVPQTISVFEFQKLDDSLPTPPIQPAATTTGGATPVAANQIAPERPGDIRYRNRRLIALYFDMTSMPEGDQIRALGAAQKFITSQIKAA